MEEYREQLNEEQRAKLNELYPTYPWSSIRDLFKFLPSEILINHWEGDKFYYVPCGLRISKDEIQWRVWYSNINDARHSVLEVSDVELIDALFYMVIALKRDGELKPTTFICSK